MHQLFSPDEIQFGYRGLEINFVYNLNTLSLLVDVNYEEEDFDLKDEEGSPIERLRKSDFYRLNNLITLRCQGKVLHEPIMINKENIILPIKDFETIKQLKLLHEDAK